MAEDHPLRDSAGIWLGVGAVIGTLSAVPLYVGATERVGNNSLFTTVRYVSR